MTFYKGQRVLYLGKQVRVSKTGPTLNPHSKERNVWVTYGKKGSKPFPVNPKDLQADPNFPQSANAYCQRRQDLISRLARLVAWMENHAQQSMKDPTNWGYAGDLGGISEHLSHVEDSCGLDSLPLNKTVELLPVQPL